MKKQIPNPSVSKSADFLEREQEYIRQLRDLVASKPDMVDDFQNTTVKDLPVEKISNPVQKIKSGKEFMLDKARREALQQVGETLDYNELRKQFAAKAKTAAKIGGKKLLGALPLVGGVGAALMNQDASAAVPGLGDAEVTGPAQGSFDQRLEQGTLTDEEKQRLLAEQARIRALQGVR